MSSQAQQEIEKQKKNGVTSNNYILAIPHN